LEDSSTAIAARGLRQPEIAVHRVGIGAPGERAQAPVVDAGGQKRLAAADEEELAVGGEAADLVGEEETTGGLAGLLGGALLAVDEEEAYRSVERETGFEPATNSLEGCDSTPELLPLGEDQTVVVYNSLGTGSPP
jgi:hypothetical protein